MYINERYVPSNTFYQDLDLPPSRGETHLRRETEVAKRVLKAQTEQTEKRSLMEEFVEVNEGDLFDEELKHLGFEIIMKEEIESMLEPEGDLPSTDYPIQKVDFLSRNKLLI